MYVVEGVVSVKYVRVDFARQHGHQHLQQRCACIFGSFSYPGVVSTSLVPDVREQNQEHTLVG